MSVVLFTNTTLVELELTGMVPEASGSGSSSVPPSPCDLLFVSNGVYVGWQCRQLLF